MLQLYLLTIACLVLAIFANPPLPHFHGYSGLPATGSVSFSLYTKCSIQEGEVAIVGPDNCRSPNDGIGTISWNKAEDWIEMCVINASLARNVTFKRPKDYDWQVADTPYNRHIQKASKVDYWSFCLVADLTTDKTITYYYDKRTGILIGSEGNVGGIRGPEHHIMVRKPADVHVWEGKPFRVAEITPQNPYGRTSHCERIRYQSTIEPLTGTGGGFAHKLPYQLCEPEESIGCYYSPWGVSSDYAVSGDDIVYSLTNGSGIGLVTLLEPGFDPIRTNIHSWMLGPSGGVGGPYALPLFNSHTCGNNINPSGPQLQCEGSEVIPPAFGFVPFGLKYDVKPWCNDPKKILDPKNPLSCTCVNSE